MTEPSAHNASTYINWHCRCEECRADHARKTRLRRRRRARMLAADPSLAKHGENSTYLNWGCRCDACRAAHNGRLT